LNHIKAAHSRQSRRYQPINMTLMTRKRLRVSVINISLGNRTSCYRHRRDHSNR
jgi:hypothetical protein